MRLHVKGNFGILQLSCSIPDDHHIVPSWPALFMARSVLRTLFKKDGVLQIRLHKAATTTPGIGRPFRQVRSQSVVTSTEHYGISGQTIWKGHKRAHVSRATATDADNRCRKPWLWRCARRYLEDCGQTINPVCYRGAFRGGLMHLFLRGSVSNAVRIGADNVLTKD